MILAEIHELLRERFGEAIGDVDESVQTPWFSVAPERWAEVARALRDDAALRFDMLRNLCGVDYPAEGRMAVVCHLFSFEHRHEVAVKVFIDRESASIQTISDLWPAADWHEREAYDLFGIVFTGHPDLRRMFLPEDWAGHPLRKDYQMPESYHGIPNIVE